MQNYFRYRQRGDCYCDGYETLTICSIRMSVGEGGIEQIHHELGNINKIIIFTFFYECGSKLKILFNFLVINQMKESYK